MPDRIALATRNPHKLRELAPDLRRLAGRLGERRDARPAAFPDVEETGDTYLDNAALKARAVAAALGLPALADDSGIEVDALGGAPGPRSARYAGERATDEENLRALIQAVRGVPAAGRTARYRCVAALAQPDGGSSTPKAICEGTLRTSAGGLGRVRLRPDLRARRPGGDDGRARPTRRRTGSATGAGRSGRSREILDRAIPERRPYPWATELKVARRRRRRSCSMKRTGWPSAAPAADRPSSGSSAWRRGRSASC